jgi:hypothetical protein
MDELDKQAEREGKAIRTMQGYTKPKRKRKIVNGHVELRR